MPGWTQPSFPKAWHQGLAWSVSNMAQGPGKIMPCASPCSVAANAHVYYPRIGYNITALKCLGSGSWSTTAVSSHKMCSMSSLPTAPIANGQTASTACQAAVSSFSTCTAADAMYSKLVEADSLTADDSRQPAVLMSTLGSNTVRWLSCFLTGSAHAWCRTITKTASGEIIALGTRGALSTQAVKRFAVSRFTSTAGLVCYQNGHSGVNRCQCKAFNVNDGPQIAFAAASVADLVFQA